MFGLTKRGAWSLGLAIFIVFLVLVNHSTDSEYVQKAAEHLTTARFSLSHGDIKNNTIKKSLLDDVRNRTLGFQKIFVINLAARSDRRDSTALAASFTGIDLEFVEAVREVDPKSLPPTSAQLKQATIGSWRSHMTAVRTMVEQNIETALIFEDDVDWDTRVKDQLYGYAHASQMLLQPLAHDNVTYLDPTYHGNIEGQTPIIFKVGEHEVKPATTSPYGDVDLWDMLWLGHCGANLPQNDGEYNIPLARVQFPDSSIMEKDHYIKQFGDEIPDEVPRHHRIAFRTDGNVCSYAYALTLQGARRLLYELGLKQVNAPFDNDLDAWCRGRDKRPSRTCLSSIPGFMYHHRPAGLNSHLSSIDTGEDTEDNYNTHSFSENLVQGVKAHFAALTEGRTDFDS